LLLLEAAEETDPPAWMVGREVGSEIRSMGWDERRGEVGGRGSWFEDVKDVDVEMGGRDGDENGLFFEVG